MERIIKVKKSHYTVWLDLSNLPYKSNGKSIDYATFKTMDYVKAPFEYKGLNDTLYIKYYTHIPDSKFIINYKGEETVVTYKTLSNVSLEKITYDERKRKGLIKRFKGKRTVDLSNLPNLSEENYFKYSNKIIKKDFSNSIGCTIKYDFEGFKGKAEIVDYFSKEDNKGVTKHYIKLKNGAGVFLYNIYNVLIGNLEKLTNTFKYPYNIGDVVGKFTVIDYIVKEYVSYNGIVNTDRFLQLKCNECGVIKNVQVSQINNHSKEYCSDCSSMKKSLKELNKHRSRGESMVEQVLKQQDIEYIAEKSFDWSNRKRYDFYLPEDGCVIEVHGVQHYLEQNEGQRFSLTLEENKKNDKWKKDQAIAHGLKYIEIDVRDHNFDYIKQSIIDSVIPTEDVDWKAVYKYMENGFIIEVIELYNSGLTPNEIGKKLNLTGDTIKKRLSKATELGLASYTPFDYNIRQVEKKLKRMKKERQEYLDKIRDQD